jgi:hypothetical protein
MLDIKKVVELLERAIVIKKLRFVSTNPSFNISSIT